MQRSIRKMQLSNFDRNICYPTILVLYISHSTQCPNSASNRPRLLIPNYLQFLSHPNKDTVESETQSIDKPFKPSGYDQAYH